MTDSRPPVRVLCVADEESPALTTQRLRALAPDVVVGCGDLPWRYLEFVSSATDAPLVFVPGNHDPHRPHVTLHRSGLWTRAGIPTAPPRPLGGTDVDLRVTTVAGLTIAGLGGCVRYRSGPHQYTQREYAWRVARLSRRVARALRRSGQRLDLLVTHAPPRGVGDEEDRPHQGIEALHTAIERLDPRLLVHGHIHPHGRPRPDRQVGTTTVSNVVPFRLFVLQRP